LRADTFLPNVLPVSMLSPNPEGSKMPASPAPVNPGLYNNANMAERALDDGLVATIETPRYIDRLVDKT